MKTPVITLIALALSLLLAACGQPAAGGTSSEPLPASTRGMTNPAAAAAGPTATEESLPIIAAETPAFTETAAAITHAMIPPEPSYSQGQAIPECSTGARDNAGGTTGLSSGCDVWQNSILERPFSADLQTFFPYLDIGLANMGTDGTWYFGKIEVFDGAQAPTRSGVYYLFELDSNLDGRGDLLVLAKDLPQGAAGWTADNVQVWRDTNGDVGGKSSFVPNEGVSGDGYDQLVFDGGRGSDPDLAWARRSPNSPGRIEFAFKAELLSGSHKFGWWAWAFQGDFQASQFDLVDTQPSAALYELDNTCAWTFGGSLPGFANQCYVNVPAPTTAAPVGCVQPPSPNPQDNGWKFNWTKCLWELIN